MDAAALRRPEANSISRKTAIRFIVLLGIVSLFGDMTYEGARSITGPYLGVLGASATIVGIVAGLGELFGYGVRLLSGWLGDRTQRYWAVMIVGYALNLFAVPLLALTSRWEVRGSLDYRRTHGPRHSFSCPGHNAVARGGSHRTWLGVRSPRGDGPVGRSHRPALGRAQHSSCTMVTRRLSRFLSFQPRSRWRSSLRRGALFPRPRDFDLTPPALHGRSFHRSYWIYMAAVALIGAGYVDFALIGYHFSQGAVVSPPVIPILFAVAMASDANRGSCSWTFIRPLWCNRTRSGRLTGGNCLAPRLSWWKDLRNPRHGALGVGYGHHMNW